MKTNAQTATVYTETVVYAPPQQYAADAPYQLAIIQAADGSKKTVRILATEQCQRVSIGDTVSFVEERNGVAFYRKAEREPKGNPTQVPQPLV